MLKKLLILLLLLLVGVGSYKLFSGAKTESGDGQMLLQPVSQESAAPAHVSSIVPTTPETPTVVSFSNIAQPEIEAKSWLLMDVDTGQILAEKDPDIRVEPASLTKLMTASLVFDALDKRRIALDQTVIVTPEARAAEGSRMFIEVNTPVKISDLVQGMVVQSGNDASILLAQTVGGTLNVFVDQMNQRARDFGMPNTSYGDPTGLPSERTFTTARDMSVLAQHIILDHPDYYHYFSQLEYTYNNIRQHNRNGLLRRNLGVDGLKTGHTSSAGYSLITTAVRDGRRLLAVVIGAPSQAARERANQSLLDWGYANFVVREVAAAGAEVIQPRVWEAKSKTVKLGAKNKVAVTVPRGRENQVQSMTQLSGKLVAPLAAGQQVGMVQFVLDGHILKQDPLVVIEPVEQASFFGRLWDKLMSSF
ncbi:peptidase [Oligella urethralis]|uniref:D-alanyl-D-alanine carboxypeptidase family protein n=1 Tax=Oligella urethralis TaxID=90245 RepID=UPI000D009E03|nr:D-alanyl-D-alanine carboxypeptidase family protein [Oligella urethralis]AVL71749.1 peptidase [Oligella urethralis]